MKLKGTLTPIQLMHAEQLRLIWNTKKKELNLTQEKVAMLCQWNTQAAFNAYLLGRMPLNIDAVLRLAKVLQVHPAEIMPELSDILPYSTSENSVREESLSKPEKMIVNLLRSIWEEKINAITNKNLEELNLHYKKKQEIASELVAAYSEITALQLQASSRATEFINLNRELVDINLEQAKRASELIIANTEMAFQNSEKGKRADELELANTELAFQNSEKQKRADELEIANIELAFQNSEKQKRADELEIANIELAFQKNEKENLAAELKLANTDLVFRNSEKGKRAAELELAYEKIAIVNEEFKTVNEDLISEGVHKAKLVTELEFQNSEKQKRADELEIANIELAFQN
ncbi:MAG: hypothetical protein NTZ70_00740, partial [Methylococcales bacterium]|nr:hypothetical protein [Methylococcales bacterium]